MNNMMYPCHPLYGNQRQDCCMNCGQLQGFTFPSCPPLNSCCCPKQCMPNCSFDNQNMMALFRDFPSQDCVGNKNPVHVLNMLNSSCNNNIFDCSDPFCRAYSIASSKKEGDCKTSSATDNCSNIPNTPTCPPTSNQRSYLLSCKMNQKPNSSGNVFPETTPFIRRESSCISTPSITALEEACGAITREQSLPNCSTVSTMANLSNSRTSLPWLDDLTKTDCCEQSRRESVIEKILQDQAGELAEMRRDHEQELLNLREETPSSRLSDWIEVLLENQLEDQLLLQEKHRQQLEAEEEPVKEQKQRRSIDSCNSSLLRTKSLSYNAIVKSSSSVKRNSCSMQHGDGEKRNQERSNSIISNGLRSLNNSIIRPQSRQNSFGGLRINSINPIVESNMGAPFGFSKPASLPPQATTCPTTCSGFPACSKPSAQKSWQFPNVQRRTPIVQHSDPWRDIRMAALETEISDGQKTIQKIADAMVELTINYTKDVVAQTVQQTQDNARMSYEQKERDSEAAAHVTALQIEKDSIDATNMWLQSAKISAKERKEIEDLAIKLCRLHEEQLSQVNHKEIDLTEAAIRRQLAEEEANAVLRQIKDDDLYRAAQRKQELLNEKSKEESALAELTARRKMAEMTAEDIANMRKFEEREAFKNRAAIENTIAENYAFAKAIAISAEKRRKDCELDANAERESMLKKAMMRREIESLRTEARRKDEEDEAAVANTWRREEDALLCEEHKAMLQEAANRRKQEEQELEAQKKQVIQNLADEREQKLQEQQRHSSSKLKFDYAAEEKQRKQSEELYKLHTPTHSALKQDSVVHKSGQMIRDQETKPPIDRSSLEVGAELTKAPSPIKKSAEAVGSKSTEPTPRQLTEAQLLVKKMEGTMSPQRVASKNFKKFEAKGDAPSPHMIKEAQALAHRMASEHNPHHKPPHGSVPVHLNLSQQRRLALRNHNPNRK